MAEENLVNLNKSIGLVKKSVDDLVVGVDNLSEKFLTLADRLKLGALVDLNSNFTKLTRNLTLTTGEAEKLSKTIEILSQRTANYSQRELAGITASFYKSTGALMAFRKDFDTLSERFTQKYAKDADVFAQSLVRLTEQMPDVAIAMQRGAKDIGTLSQIMRTAGREGVSAYLAAINEIPNETESSINKTETQVKRLQSIWDNAKVNLGKTLSETFGFLGGIGESVGGFAQKHPLVTGAAQTVAGIAGNIGMMALQAKLIRGGSLFGGGGRGGGGGGSFGGMNQRGFLLENLINGGTSLDDALAGNFGSGGIYSTGKGFSVAPNVSRSYFGGMSNTAKLGAAGALFLGGHALTGAFTEAGSNANLYGQFATNAMSGAVAGSVFGAPGAAVGAGVGAASTGIMDYWSSRSQKAVADEAYRTQFREFLADRQAAKLRTSDLGYAEGAVDRLTGKEGYNVRGEALLALAKARGTQADIYGKEGFGAQSASMRTQAVESMTAANQAFQRSSTILASQIGQTQQQMQYSLRYGGAGGEGLGNTINNQYSEQIRAVRGQLATLGTSDVDQEKRAQLETQLQQLNMEKGFAGAAFESQRQMAGAALTARGARAEASLRGARGGSLSEFAGAQRAAAVGELQAGISAKWQEANMLPVSAEGAKKYQEILAEISEKEYQKLQAIAQEKQMILQGTEQEVSTQEALNKLYNPESPKKILDIMQKRLEITKSLVAVETDPARKKALQEQEKQQQAAADLYSKFGVTQANLGQQRELLQISAGAYGTTGTTTQSEMLRLQILEKEAELAAKGGQLDPYTKKKLQAELESLRVQKQITDEVGKARELNEANTNITQMQLQRMQTLRAPVGVIAQKNRELLDLNRENLKIAERDLEIKRKGPDRKAALEAQQRVEQAKNAIAASLDFERRSYADMFTAQTFGMGQGSYLFPAGMSGYSLQGPNYTTGWSGYGIQGGGTYSTQVANAFGPGYDERSPMDKLYNSLVNDGMKLQEGTTLVITGMTGNGNLMTQVANKAAK